MGFVIGALLSGKVNKIDSHIPSYFDYFSRTSRWDGERNNDSGRSSKGRGSINRYFELLIVIYILQL
jgi:hypothetical protein